MRAHGKDEDRDGENGAKDHAARKVDKLRIGALLARGNTHRLQRHAANGASARSLLDDLGMHRARVLRARRHRFGSGGTADVFPGVRFEFLPAARRAKIDVLPIVLGPVLGR